MQPYPYIGVLVMSFVTAACSVFGVRSEENPTYRVEHQEDNKEIREYEAYIAAKTTVQGEFKAAQNEAFRILAKYIFGENYGEQKITMTSPVVVANTGEKARDGTKISMTAPVLQEKRENGWTMSFMMPSQYKLEDLPKPKDDRIVFERVPSRLMAAITYSWGRDEARNAAMAKALLDWLAPQDSFRVTSSPVSAGYDPPWTLPFLRRNEMMVELVRTASRP